MKNRVYTSFEEVDKDLKVLSLRRQIAHEEIKGDLMDIKSHFEPSGRIPEETVFLLACRVYNPQVQEVKEPGTFRVFSLNPLTARGTLLFFHGLANLVARRKGGHHVIEHIAGGFGGVWQQDEIGIGLLPYGL